MTLFLAILLSCLFGKIESREELARHFKTAHGRFDFAYLLCGARPHKTAEQRNSRTSRSEPAFPKSRRAQPSRAPHGRGDRSERHRFRFKRGSLVQAPISEPLLSESLSQLMMDRTLDLHAFSVSLRGLWDSCWQPSLKGVPRLRDSNKTILGSSSPQEKHQTRSFRSSPSSKCWRFVSSHQSPGGGHQGMAVP